MPQLGWHPQESWPHSAVGPVHQIGPVREGGHETDREPVALGNAETNLVLDVVGHVRESVALCETALFADVLVAAGEADRLERKEADFLGIVERELDDAANLLVVNAVNDGRHRDDIDAGFVQIVDGLELYVEEIADLAVRVGGVADAVELEVDVAETSFGSGAAEFFALREFNAVRSSLHRVVANLARVGDGVKEVGRQRGLATRELNAHLAPGLHVYGVVEHGLNFVPGELVDESDLVGIHEARIAHHVAAVCEVDGEHRAPSMGHCRRAVVVQLVGGGAMRADVAAGEALFKVLEEGRVDGHHVFKVAVLGAVLHHQDLAVALDDLRLDFADLFIQQNFVGQLAVEDLLADLGNALGTERVCGAGPAQRRLLFLIALQEWLLAPFGGKRRVGADAVQPLKDHPRALGRVYGGLLGVLHRFRHFGAISLRKNALANWWTG